MVANETDLRSHTQRGQTWQKMTVGSRLLTSARTITETDLVNFVTNLGFTEPLFMDARHAAEANPGYTGRLVPGALVFCLAEGLVMQQNVLNGTGVAFMQAELNVRLPVFVGDTIDCLVEVTESRPTSSGENGVVTTRNTVRNQRGEDVLEYTPVRLIKGDALG